MAHVIRRLAFCAALAALAAAPRFATAGLGPVIGWIKPLGQQSLTLEFKWLAETEVKNRVKGDYLWLKAVYKF